MNNNWSYILMSETNLWRYLQRNLKDNKTMLMRIENPFYKGIPDVNFLIDGNEGWLELKYMPEYPKKDNTEVKVPHFTKEQKLWHDSRYKNKGLVGALTKKKMFQHANKSWKNRIDFKELRKELCA
jgi:hypothetical protein